jgi:hypothetical protein
MESKILQGVSSPPVVQRIKESNIPSPLSATQQALSATQRAIQRIRTFKEKKVNLVRNEREEEELKQQNALNSALRKALHLSSLQHQSPSTRKQHSDVVVDDSEQQYDGDEAADSRFPDENSSSSVDKISLEDVRARADVLSEVVRGFRVMEAQSAGGLSIMADFKRGFSAAARHAAENDRDAFESISATVRDREKKIEELEVELTRYRKRAEEGDSAKGRVRLLEEQLAFTNADASKRIAAAEKYKSRVLAAENALVEERRVLEDRLLLARRSYEISLVEATATLQARCLLQEQMVQQMRQDDGSMSSTSEHDGNGNGGAGVSSSFKSIQAASAVFKNLQEVVEQAVAEAVAEKVSCISSLNTISTSTTTSQSNLLSPPLSSVESSGKDEEIERLNEEIDFLRQQLLDARAESSMLESTNSLLRSSASKTDAAIAEAESLRALVQEAKNEHNKTISALEETQREHAMLTKSLVRLRAVEFQLTASQTQTGLSEQTVKEKEAEIARLAKEIEMVHKSYEDKMLTMVQEKAALCDQFTRAEGEAAEAKVEVARLKSELSRVSADEITIQTQAARLSKLLESEEETASLAAHGLQSELETTRKALSEANSAIKVLDAQLAIERTAKSKAAVDSAEHKIVAEKCMLELEAAQLELISAQNDRSAALLEAEKLRREIQESMSDSSAQLERTAKILSEEEGARERLESEKEALSVENAGHLKTISDLLAKNESLEAQISTLRTLMETISLELQDLEAEKDKLFQERNAVRKERDVLLLQHEEDSELLADVVHLREEAESFETARSRLRGIIESRDLTINQNEEDIRSLRNEVESLKMDLEDARAMKKTLLSGGGGGGSDSAQKLAQLQTRLSAKEKELKESQDEMDSIVSDLLSQKANLTLQVDKLTQENLDLKKNRKK